MTTPNKPYVITAEDFDSDAQTARSAAYRVVRDAVRNGAKEALPADDKGSLTDEAKGLHNAAALSARTACNTLYKAATDKKKRAEWTQEETVKAHRWLCQQGVKVYRDGLKANGYEAPDSVVADAAKEFEEKMVECANKRKVQAAVADVNADALSSIFGS